MALRLIERADVLIEGFRPGVMESLGLGPEVCLERRPSLVYGRVTGWGQDGPLAQAAGHDINYTALSGALHSSARRGSPPTPTPGLIGDFGGGGMLLAFGVLAALAHARDRPWPGGRRGDRRRLGAADRPDPGLALGRALERRSRHQQRRRRRPFLRRLRCADGKYVSIGAMEPQFYALLREKCGLEDPGFDAQWDPARWPALKERVAAIFRTRTRANGASCWKARDVCFAPVLDLDEAPRHPHNRARGTFAEVDGITQPAPAPRFARPRGTVPAGPRAA